MRATIVTAAFLMLLGCGGRTLLDDPDNGLVLPDGGHGVKIGDGGSTTKKDGGGSGGMMGMACGSSRCDAQTEDCCGMATGTGGTTSGGFGGGFGGFGGGGGSGGTTPMGSLSCVPKGKCTMGVVVGCGSASDCGEGEVCCGALPAGGIASLFGGGGTGGGITVSCESKCSSNGFQLCNSDSECSKGVTCQDTGFGAKLCGGFGAITGGTGGFGGFGGFGDAGFGGFGGGGGGTGGFGGFGGH
jgi:hypothetical protein